MPLLLILAFNWFVMFFVLQIVVGFFHSVKQYEAFLLVGASFLIVCGLAFLFNSSMGQWILRLISGARKTITREDTKLNPVIERVQDAIKTTFGFEHLPVHVMVVDSPLPNAFAIGKQTLVVSRGLYETATEDELAGVIAHEFGHLHNGDSHKLGIALGVSLVSMVSAGVASIIAVFLQGFSKFFEAMGGDAGKFLALFGYFFIFVAAFFLLFVRLGNWMLKLSMLFVGRKQEYKADEFAVKVGFGSGLLSFLDKLKNMQFEEAKGLFARLYDTHPPTMIRIDAVEKAMG
ncbi:MAG: M48 family metalloprotease [Gammaproteobacteria bacterium]